MEKTKESKEFGEFRVSHVPMNIHDEITNIAQNLGVSVPSFLKTEFQKIRERYPENMRKAKSKD